MVTLDFYINLLESRKHLVYERACVDSEARKAAKKKATKTWYNGMKQSAAERGCFMILDIARELGVKSVEILKRLEEKGLATRREYGGNLQYFPCGESLEHSIKIHKNIFWEKAWIEEKLQNF